MKANFDPTNKNHFKHQYLLDCFKCYINKQEEQNADIFSNYINERIEEYYKSINSLEKNYFITALNSRSNELMSKENYFENTNQYWNKESENEYDYLLKYLDNIEAITRHHNSIYSLQTEINNSNPELLDLNESKLNIRIVYLIELGIIDFLKEKYNIVSTNKLAEVISAFSGIGATTACSYLNPMKGDFMEQKNNPNKEANIKKVKKNLINLDIGY